MIGWSGTESEKSLLLHIARVELKLARGGPALAALDSADRIQMGAAEARSRGMATLQSRALALVHFP